MVTTVDAVYDGRALHPDTPLALEPNTRVRVTIEIVAPGGCEAGSFLRTARSLNLDGPRDWAENIETYLYGGERTRDE